MAYIGLTRNQGYGNCEYHSDCNDPKQGGTAFCENENSNLYTAIVPTTLWCEQQQTNNAALEGVAYGKFAR